MEETFATAIPGLVMNHLCFYGVNTHVHGLDLLPAVLLIGLLIWFVSPGTDAGVQGRWPGLVLLVVLFL